MDILIVQITLGVLLFFIINWIGKHSYSIGYIEISMFVKVEEAPAFNFLIRVLTPIVYLIIISTILYYFNLDRYVYNIYLVNIYYILFRLFFNLLTNRGLLLNWYRQFLYWLAIISISYFTYDKLIKEKSNILPDFTTISNELWIIILIFIFQILNNVRVSNDGTIKRKENYLKSRYSHFKKLYGTKIKEITKNELLEALTYSIMIYEDFNRPKSIRIIENLNFKLSKKPHTLGLMQIKSNRILTDEESVYLGTEKIVNAYKNKTRKKKKKSKQKEDFEIINENNEVINNYSTSWFLINDIILDYNNCSKYSDEVFELYTIIKDTFYKNTSDKL